MSTKNDNVTFNALLTKIANRRKRGITVGEAFEAITKAGFVSNDDSPIRRTTVRARMYELANKGVLVPSGTRTKNGRTSTVYVPFTVAGAVDAFVR